MVCEFLFCISFYVTFYIFNNKVLNLDYAMLVKPKLGFIKARFNAATTKKMSHF